MNLALKYLCQQTKTKANQWISIDGIPSGVGSEFWYKNKTNKKEAYICIDQGEVTACSIKDEE